METFFLDLADGVFKNFILMCATRFLLPNQDYVLWGITYILSAIIFFGWEFTYNQVKFYERLKRINSSSSS